MTNPTASEIYGKTEDLLKLEGSTIGIPGVEEDRTLEWINDLQIQFFQEFFDAGLTLPSYMRGEFGADLLGATNLDGAVTTTDTEIDLDSGTNASSAGGVIAVYDGTKVELIPYTGKSTNQLTGVTGIDYGHDDDETVRFLYQLPSAFWRPRPELNMGHGITVNGAPYREVPSDPINGEFAVHEVVSSGVTTSYLWLRDTSGKMKLAYEKQPTTISATGTYLNIPRPHHLYVVYGLLAIFKQTLDDDYFPEKEYAMMAKYRDSAFKKRTAGKSIRIRGPFTDRNRSVNLRRLYISNQVE